jgi:hypothetical protein
MVMMREGEAADCFREVGEMALFTEDRRSTMVRAVPDWVVVRFPALLRNLIRIQIQRLQSANP